MSTIIRLAEQQDAAEILALTTAFATSFEIDLPSGRQGNAQYPSERRRLETAFGRWPRKCYD